jgi:hypothetical protein
VAGVIVGFCAAVYALTLTFDSVPASLATGMQPEVFPRLVLGVLVVLAAALALSARGQPDPAREPVPRAVYATIAAIVAFMGVLYVAGMTAAILSSVAIGWLWGERRWSYLAIVAVGLAIAIHVVFVIGFHLSLPAGLIHEWLS